MNILRLFDKTESMLRVVNNKIRSPYTQESREELKEQKDYLLDILALLFKELER